MEGVGAKSKMAFKKVIKGKKKNSCADISEFFNRWNTKRKKDQTKTRKLETFPKTTRMIFISLNSMIFFKNLQQNWKEISGKRKNQETTKKKANITSCPLQWWSSNSLVVDGSWWSSGDTKQAADAQLFSLAPMGSFCLHCGKTQGGFGTCKVWLMKLASISALIWCSLWLDFHWVFFLRF